MKLVIQEPNRVEVRILKDFELEDAIAVIKAARPGHVEEPLPYEIFRYRFPKGVAVIYHDNRVLRAKNFWFEMRGLTALARTLKTSFLHAQRVHFENELETEVDGIDVDTHTIMVELKQAPISQEWVDFYENKRKRLGFKECLIAAPWFDTDLTFPPAIRPFIFQPDVATLMDFYNERFTIPSWIAPHIPPRHVRILLSNGVWHGIHRKLTFTAKHTPASKILLTVNNLAKRSKFPMRVYFSLSPMVLPTQEYFGKGRPLPRILGAFDVDAEHKDHIMGPEGYCVECLRDAREKADILAEKLTGLGKSFIRVYSGSKGFHFYLRDTKDPTRVGEFDEESLSQITAGLQDSSGNALTDNINFRTREGTFDMHRIFKLPGTVDAATGIVVSEQLEQLNFKDELYPLKR